MRKARFPSEISIKCDEGEVKAAMKRSYEKAKVKQRAKNCAKEILDHWTVEDYPYQLRELTAIIERHMMGDCDG